MSVQYKFTQTKNHRSRIVSNDVTPSARVTATVNREDNAEFVLASTPQGRTLYIQVPRSDGTGLDNVQLNGRQIRTLVRLFDRHAND